jgi:hypothetical protein
MNQIYALLAVLLILGCTQNRVQEDNLMSQVVVVHEEMLEIERQFKPTYVRLTNLKNVLLQQTTPLSEREMMLVKKVESIEKNYEFWVKHHSEISARLANVDEPEQSQGVSVSTNYEPADMLEIQQEFMDNLLSIQKRLKLLTAST